MRKEIKTVEITCDFCGILIAPAAAHGTVLTKDVCAVCLSSLMDSVEKEYQRVVHRAVPAKGGGWRNLGEYDG